ncbi:MAG: lysylphosphatidylglycerol synthase transmembrane domain-containing protein [Candidatus Methanoperedens sp.]
MSTILKRDIKTTIFLLLGACGIIGIILWKIGIGNFYDKLSNINPQLLIASIFLTLLSFVIKLIRWSLLFKHARTVDAFKIYFIGQGVNQIGPFGSGELARAYTANKKLGIPIGKTLISSAIERISDTLFLSIMALMGVTLLIPGRSSFQIGVLILFITILGVILIRPGLIFKFKWMFDRFTKKSSGRLDSFVKKISGLLLEFSDTLSRFGEQKLLAGAIFLLTLAAWGANALAIYMLFLSFSIHSTLIYVLIISSMAEIIGVIVPIPGGLGTKDASFAWLFSLVGVPIETGIIIYLVYRGVNYLLLGGGVFISLLSFSNKYQDG